MSTDSSHTAAFVLSLIGGFIIIVGGITAAFLSTFGSPYGMFYGMGSSMMGGHWFGYGSGWMLGLIIVSIVCGIIVVFWCGNAECTSNRARHLGYYRADLLNRQFHSMGGYFISAILGIAGGAIALSYRAM